MGQKLSLHSLQYAHVWSDVTVLHQHSFCKQLFFKATRFRCGEICHKSSLKFVLWA